MAVFADRSSAPASAVNRTRHLSRVAATAGLGLGTLAGIGLLAQGSVLFGAGALLAASTLWQASLLGRRARRQA
ncbi:MAG: hypothetical protein ACK4K3_13575 [Aquabacterium sp.]|jgi:hypothetical protein